MAAFPPISRQGTFNADDRASAVDFVNRVNWFFETWDVEAMIDAFLPDAVAYHFHGTIRGHAEIRRFFEHDYPYLIPGVGRHATNHIVDADGDGVVVRYQNLLIRHAAPEDAPKLGAGQVMHSDSGLPAIWLYSPMRDRLRKTSTGWKIYERYIGGSITNHALTPVDTSAVAVAPYLPSLQGA
ncbi:nuclear transport factor 2 family protein [Paraburkholderia strydomiana]|uniref:nuclear transport factor 2 family protein n=1 Tax=Paraburkholderia strydomiana TaxID=1245417 RepID=UPI0038BACD09